MSKIVVFTSITGNKDLLKENQNTKGAEFVAFCDQKSKVWKIRKPFQKFKDRRYNYKPPKILPHLYFETDYSLWMNGSLEIKIPVFQLIKEWMDKNTDIALFRHFSGRSVYQEIEEERKFNKDNLEDLNSLERFFREQGMPEDFEMGECGLILRKHNERVKRFNEKWWSLITRFTQRDQTIFAYLNWKLKDINVRYIEGDFRNHPYFNFYKHLDEDPSK